MLGYKRDENHICTTIIVKAREPQVAERREVLQKYRSKSNHCTCSTATGAGSLHHPLPQTRACKETTFKRRHRKCGSCSSRRLPTGKLGRL